MASSGMCLDGAGIVIEEYGSYMTSAATSEPTAALTPPDVQVFLAQSDRELLSLKESSCSLSDSHRACGHTR
eukprot:12020130-Heterocapsa_arctica.AAC.1